jgi:hypothetical protein
VINPHERATRDRSSKAGSGKDRKPGRKPGKRRSRMVKLGSELRGAAVIAHGSYAGAMASLSETRSLAAAIDDVYRTPSGASVTRSLP